MSEVQILLTATEMLHHIHLDGHKLRQNEVGYFLEVCQGAKICAEAKLAEGQICKLSASSPSK